MRRLLSLVAVAATTATLAPAASAACYPIQVAVAGEETEIRFCPFE